MVQLQTEFGQRRVQNLMQRKRGWTGALLRTPDHMQNDVLECGILVVPMRSPTVRAKVDFHITGGRWLVPDLNDRCPKVRPTLQIAEPGMKHPHALPVQRLELGALKTLMLPDGLEQSLGRQIGCVPQTHRLSLARTPIGIEAGGGKGHLGLLLRWCFRKVKCHEKEFLNETKVVFVGLI